MKQTFPILAAAAMLPACATVKGAASDAGAVGKTAVQMVRDIPDLPLPALPQADPTPYKETSEEVRAYCEAVNLRWNYGKEQVATGEEFLAEGREIMKDGQRVMRDGERRIATGKLAVEEARRELAIKTGRARPETRDYANLTDPEYVKALRVKLEQAIKRMEFGSEQVAHGASEIAKGQARAQNGIERLKQGHALMAEDTGRCRDIALPDAAGSD